MRGNICVLGQQITLPVIKNSRPMLAAPFIGGTNLCKEIILPMFAQETKYKFSREWYVADYDWVHHAEVLEWCTKQFGPHPQRPDAWSRWQNKYTERIHFRDEKDYHWFILRWGA